MTENDDKSVQLQLNLDDPTMNDKLLKENIQLHKQIAFLLSENKRLNQMLKIGKGPNNNFNSTAQLIWSKECL
jgi:hypothetical protein